jgi:hypothetical protein
MNISPHQGTQKAQHKEHETSLQRPFDNDNLSTPNDLGYNWSQTGTQDKLVHKGSRSGQQNEPPGAQSKTRIATGRGTRTPEITEPDRGSTTAA